MHVPVNVMLAPAVSNMDDCTAIDTTPAYLLHCKHCMDWGVCICMGYPNKREHLAYVGLTLCLSMFCLCWVYTIKYPGHVYIKHDL